MSRDGPARSAGCVVALRQLVSQLVNLGAQLGGFARAGRRVSRPTAHHDDHHERHPDDAAERGQRGQNLVHQASSRVLSSNTTKCSTRGSGVPGGAGSTLGGCTVIKESLRRGCGGVSRHQRGATKCRNTGTGGILAAWIPGRTVMAQQGRRFAPGLVMLAALVALGGCGGGSSSSPSTAASGQGQPASVTYVPAGPNPSKSARMICEK